MKDYEREIAAAQAALERYNPHLRPVPRRRHRVLGWTLVILGSFLLGPRVRFKVTP